MVFVAVDEVEALNDVDVAQGSGQDRFAFAFTLRDIAFVLETLNLQLCGWGWGLFEVRSWRAVLDQRVFDGTAIILALRAELRDALLVRAPMVLVAVDEVEAVNDVDVAQGSGQDRCAFAFTLRDIAFVLETLNLQLRGWGWGLFEVRSWRAVFDQRVFDSTAITLALRAELRDALLVRAPMVFVAVDEVEAVNNVDVAQGSGQDRFAFAFTIRGIGFVLE